ncbi:MAG: tol-pal system protein YbgF [Pseudomonadota bacterium]
MWSRHWPAALVLLAALGVQSQTAAQESAGPATAAAPATAAPTAAAPTQDRRLSELFYQLQVLQQEVQELRGLVEEQAYQLNRLARDQKEQYIDLDRRVAGLTTGAVVAGGGTSAAAGSAGAASGGLSAGGQGATAGSAAAPVAALPSASGVSEREAYQAAFDLMKARQFDQSIAAFNGLIVDYPNGQFTPNAFYWLGELHLAQQNTEQARQSFMQVINLYPDHPKIPDTLYKLGVAYHRLGDTSRALEYFGQVQSNYPQSSAAGLAASYQQELR